LWEQQVRFGLSPEEIGVMLHELPLNKPVEFVRSVGLTQQQQGYGDVSDKVFRVVPFEGGQYDFSIDHEKDGVSDGTSSPMTATVQLGEYQVLRELMSYSIPYLTGWATLVEIGLKGQKDAADQGCGGGMGRNPYGDVPF
jgi:hypothetical protein